jgi:hypothetical protein
VLRRFGDGLGGLGHGCRCRVEARTDGRDARQVDAVVGSAKGPWVEALTDTDELRLRVQAE